MKQWLNRIVQSKVYQTIYLKQLISFQIGRQLQQPLIILLATVFNNVLQDITNGNKKTEIFWSVFLFLIVDYYKNHHYIFRLSEKEQKILKPYFVGLTASLRESYSGNQSSILVERLYKFVGTDIANTLFDKIHDYPELCWIHMDLPTIAVSSEWSVPKNFFSKPTSSDSNEFVGVVFRLYRDPAFIKAHSCHNLIIFYCRIIKYKIMNVI